MITSSPFRAGLVISLAASLPIRAAAQNSDADFAAALGQAAPAFATRAQWWDIFRLPDLPAPTNIAASKGPSAPEAVWQKVLEAVKTGGTYKPERDLSPDSFSLVDVAGDPKSAHVLQSISFLGLINDNEKFQAMSVKLVFKDYSFDPKDGNRRIDQWEFATDVYGLVQQGGHAIVIQTPDGKIVSRTRDALRLSDPKMQTQYDLMLKHWAERKP